jgi:probable F420-dependent oxidoreductase
MRLGLALPHYDTSLAGRPVDWPAVARIAQLAERSGFSSVWVSDHLFLDWGKYGGPSTPQGALECWTTLSGLAAVTDRVRLGSLTLCNDLRSPALVAKMAATLDLLSGGRLDIGMGAGWYEPEFRAADIPFDPPGTRIRRLGEAAEIVTRLLEGEELIYKGRYYTIDGALARPGPAQEPRPPLWIGGKGDLLLKTAARVADGWNYSWIGSIDGYRQRAEAADRTCEAAGRPPEGLRRSVGAFVLVGRTEADLRNRFDRVVERTPDGVLAGVSFEEFRRGGLIGTVDEVIDRIGRLTETGVEEVVVAIGALPFQVADEEDVELVGTEIAAVVGRG